MEALELAGQLVFLRKRAFSGGVLRVSVQFAGDVELPEGHIVVTANKTVARVIVKDLREVHLLGEALPSTG